MSGRSHRQKLARREQQIMDVLYVRGEASVATVLEELPDPPSYSAVRATLRILEEKGHVVHRKNGRQFVYAPAVSAERARATALRQVVRTFFGGSFEDAVTALLRISDADLTDAEIEPLARKIRRARREGR